MGNQRRLVNRIERFREKPRNWIRVGSDFSRFTYDRSCERNRLPPSSSISRTICSSFFTSTLKLLIVHFQSPRLRSRFLSAKGVSAFSGSQEFLLPSSVARRGSARSGNLQFFRRIVILFLSFSDCLSNLLFRRIVFRCFFSLSFSLSLSLS